MENFHLDILAQRLEAAQWKTTTATAMATITTCFKLYRAYSILFSLSNVGSFCEENDCIEVQEKKKKVFGLCSRPQENVKLDIVTS